VLFRHIETKSNMQKVWSRHLHLVPVQVYAPQLTFGATRPPELTRNLKLSGAGNKLQ